jgi:hypothetical protein
MSRSRNHAIHMCKLCIYNHHHQWRYSPDLALASITGFVTGIYDVGLSAPRSTWSSHPDSTTRVI